jgi:DNA polymerase-3 subunit delta'
MGGRKVAIIDDADFLNQEGANALLKTLEEPPPRSVLILIGTSADKQLPTIRSRAQIIRFQPLPQDVVARLLVDRGIVADATEAHRLASYSGGSVEQAAELADPELWAFRRDLLGTLARWPVEGFKTAQSVSSFIDDAGKESPARRARTRLVIGFAIDFYRALVRRLHGQVAVEHADLGTLVEQAIRNGWTRSTAVAALERSLEALNHVDRNANQATMVECWFDDLAALSVGQATGLTVRPMA